MRTILFTGKGGAGSSTVAAATAVHGARSGVKTALVCHEAFDGLAAGEAGLSVRVLADRPAGEPGPGLFDALGVDPVAADELAWLPGSIQLAGLLGLREVIGSGRFDLVVVDAGPLTRVCEWLSLPDTVDVLLERMLPPQRRVSRAMAAGAAPGPQPADHLAHACDGLRASLAETRRLLAAPATSARLVFGADHASLRRAARGWTALALLGVRVDGVLANRVAAGAPVLAEAGRLFSQPVRQLAAITPEPQDTDQLARLGEQLYGPPDGESAGRLLALPATADPQWLGPAGDGFELRLDLPLARREEVGLARAGDQLQVTAAGCRRVITLPGALQRCTVSGARLRDGALTISFRPDPALWRAP